MTNTNVHTESRSLADALEGLRFAMVGTADGQTWRSRPLTLAEHDGDVLRFLVSTGADWVAAVTEHSPAAVTFSDPHANTYVALQGRARVTDDRSVIARLWNPGAAAFFDGKDDPTVRVLEVAAVAGEFWDGPSGRVGQMLSLVREALGRDAGEQGRVTP